MSDIAIHVEGMGKRYRIGHRTERDGHRGGLLGKAAGSFRYLAGTLREPDQAETFWALKDVSFEVQRGEVVGIIGRNGAGKSTLLKILSRITDPTEGQAEINGRVGSLLEVGTGFHPELTGRENIYLNGAILGMKRAEIARRFDEIVAFSEVEKFLDTPVKRYSSGMYVRLAFAVAAYLEPEILVVDEVLAVGDTGFQKKCLGKMGDVAKQGRTVLFVSHNMQAIRQLSDRAIMLSSGGISVDDKVAIVVERYLRDVTGADAPSDLDLLIRNLPPDPAFRLNSIAVLQDNQPTNDVVNGKPVEIRMAYDLFEETHGFHVYFELLDSEGVMLFESLHNGDAEEIPTVAPGSYLSRAIIPADFLSAMQYLLRFKAGIYNIRMCTPSLIHVPLRVYASGRVNRAYPGYRTPGKLSPQIEWHTERTDGAR